RAHCRRHHDHDHDHDHSSVGGLGARLLKWPPVRLLVCLAFVVVVILPVQLVRFATFACITLLAVCPILLLTVCVGRTLELVLCVRVSFLGLALWGPCDDADELFELAARPTRASRELARDWVRTARYMVTPDPRSKSCH
ncbi:MAG: hypothetical protein P4L83_11645, partial [Nevskia sp.]|nr:hypothetical protein [Nevskia sp.]